MYLITALLVLASLSVDPDAADPETEQPDESPSYTLADEWDETWLRIFDRTGRPDPDGPMLQRFDADLYPRYHFDITVPEFPMATQPGWAARDHGVRMWVQSLNEFQLANRLQAKTELPAWTDGHIGLRYDRRQDRLHDRHHIRFDIGHRDIASTGLDGVLRFHPGWDKRDIDVEAILRYSADDLGDATLRIGTLDTFINGSYGLVEARGRQLDEHVRHRDVPLTAGAELASTRWRGLRAEAYGGAVLPHARHHRFPDDPAQNHERHRRALLGAGLIEWDMAAIDAIEIPIAVGATLRTVDARMSWDHDRAPDRDRRVRETTTDLRLYALSDISENLHAQFSMNRTNRPETWTGPGVPQPWAGAETQRYTDRERMATLRMLWQATDVVGADLELLRIRRDTDGPLQPNVDGAYHRGVTRLMLQLGDQIWTSFGVGWTPDPGGAIYDGGGMTLIWNPDGI